LPAKYPFLACKPKNSLEKAISPRSDLGEIFALVGLTPTPKFGVGVEKTNFLLKNKIS
jgi:hypothetical protein